MGAQNHFCGINIMSRHHFLGWDKWQLEIQLHLQATYIQKPSTSLIYRPSLFKKVIKRLKTSNVCSLHDVVMLRCLRIWPNSLDLCTVINIFLSNNSSHLSFCRHGIQWTRKCYNFCILKCLNITFNLSLENHSLNNLWTMNTRTLTRQQQSY